MSHLDGTSIRPLKVISASAGTGKTFTLSREYVQQLQMSQKEMKVNRSIVATTFTNKAAAELIERVRRLLLDIGDWDAAQGVLTGYLGTVNSICGRLLSEYAIEAGFSPDFHVIAEDHEQAVFVAAVDQVIHAYADEIDSSAMRLQIDWRRDVQEVIRLARYNDLGAKLLEGFATQSWERLKALLPPPSTEDEADETLDMQLAQAVSSSLEELNQGTDRGDTTRKAIEYLQEVDRSLRSGRVLSWQSWVRLARQTVNKPSSMKIKALQDIATAHLRHGRLHKDLEATIFGVFRCAAAALQEFTRFKREHGLIDFVDQEHLALRILRQPEVRASFQERARALLVDEFQDTSPIQLAVFLEMARLVDYSVWVGDEKQSIFGFRGSDPELMGQAVKQLVNTMGATRTRLRRSYRSRPSLVYFTNAVFTRCTSAMQISANSAVIDEVARSEHDDQQAALNLWWLSGTTQDQALNALSKSIADVLSKPDTWAVIDRHTKELRPIRGRDIAVLCRTNRSRINVAKALSARGLTIATERNGLLDTPECVLALAALRVLVDEGDTVALAELAHFMPGNHDWLDVLLTQGREGLERKIPSLQKLTDSRADLYDRTPLEVLEIAIAHGAVVETAMRWGNLRQRLANLDALRGLAKTYEEVCLSAKAPATTPGLLIYLQKQVRDGGNQPANPDENGINILTYHRAKGLEWPLVVLYDLDVPARGAPFGIVVESPEQGLNPLEPLAGRSIRYWPWPYGGQRYEGTGLDSAVTRTPEARKAMAGARAESLRLLYVGVTRARDYLVFAARPLTYGTSWLNSVVDDNQQRVFTLPLPQNGTMQACIIEDVPESLTQIEIKEAPAAITDDTLVSESVYISALPSSPLQSSPSYFLRPSTAGATDFAVRHLMEPVISEVGSRLTLSGTPEMQTVGDCLHAFFCIDRVERQRSARLSSAEAAMRNWKLSCFSAEDMVLAGDRLDSFIKEQFPQAQRGYEVPVAGFLGMRRVRGSIDLLLECDEGFVIIDHKSFPGRFEEQRRHAEQFVSQLALYSHVLETVSNKRVLAQFIHMPVVGAMIKFDCRIDNER